MIDFLKHKILNTDTMIKNHQKLSTIVTCKEHLLKEETANENIGQTKS